MPDLSNRRWITIREAAKYLSLSEHGCRKLADRGAIPAVRVGRVVRIDFKALERQLEEQLRELNRI